MAKSSESLNYPTFCLSNNDDYFLAPTDVSVIFVSLTQVQTYVLTRLKLNILIFNYIFDPEYCNAGLQDRRLW